MQMVNIDADRLVGNDFIDLSNIVGAGGNMTVEQVGDWQTCKGDPLFMQNLNTHWRQVDQGRRDSLRHCIHTDVNDNVVRIDAIKFNPDLETFVREFADGKSYIGVGAWGNSPGVNSDNAQVRIEPYSAVGRAAS